MSATTPEECDRLFGQHVNAGDLGALLALYEPGCSLVRRDGGVARGHVEIRAVLSRLVAMPARMSTEIVKVIRTGDDLVLLYNDWHMTAKAADGQAIEATGKAIEVVRRQPDGTWRFIIDDPFARG
jgi:uncharacterized protein (TIGR02246 family)